MKFWQIFCSILFLPCTHLRTQNCEVLIDGSVKKIQIKFMRDLPFVRAISVGNIIYTKVSIGGWNCEDALLVHQIQHIKQWSVYGFYFPFLYGWECLIKLLQGKHPYYDNKFEVQAYTKEYEYRVAKE